MPLRHFLALFALCFCASALSRAEDAKVPRLLFVGNSITLHGPSKDIGWEGNWGMAASAEEKDYVHLVVADLAQRGGVRPNFQAINLADFERGYATYDAAAKLKDALALRPGIVVVALGENVPALATVEARAKFTASLVRLFTLLKTTAETKLIVRSSFWPDAAKDAALKEACTAAGGTFVDLSGLAKDESNFARAERKIAHAGVAAHPGDKGMRAIADAIVAAIPK